MNYQSEGRRHEVVDCVKTKYDTVGFIGLRLDQLPSIWLIRSYLSWSCLKVWRTKMGMKSPSPVRTTPWTSLVSIIKVTTPSMVLLHPCC